MPEACPVCGSTDTSIENVIRSYTPPFGQEVELHHKVLHCNVCEEGVGLDDDAMLHMEITAADHQSVLAMMQYLSGIGITRASMQRMLRLPMTTMDQWEEGKISPGELALLRCVRAFPWLLIVADCNFSNSSAAGELRQQALRLGALPIED